MGSYADPVLILYHWLGFRLLITCIRYSSDCLSDIDLADGAVWSTVGPPLDEENCTVSMAMIPIHIAMQLDK